MTAEQDQPIRYYLVGPTGAGKKQVGVRVASDLNAEIISLDSMKVYRDVNIGTTTPDREQRLKCPFHLINVREPHEEFSVAEYIDEAKHVERRLRERGKRPLFVGGTGMYLDRLVNGLFDGPDADWSLREKLKQRAEEEGSDVLHERLQEVDPDRADEIHPNDQRRIIRALEVHEKTGRPMSELIREASERAARYDHRIGVLKWPREVLYRRINERVERLMEQGWLDEARRLKNRDPEPGRQVLQAAGYKQLFEFLEDEKDLDEAIEEIKQEHRNLAKRQMTWFRSLDAPVEWIELEEGLSTEDVVEQVLSVFQETTEKGGGSYSGNRS